jgi:hypothetical protein
LLVCAAGSLEQKLQHVGHCEFLDRHRRTSCFTINLSQKIERLMNKSPTLSSLLVRTIVVHTITYFTMGVIASRFLNYAEIFARPEMVSWMRQFNDPILRAGPLLQPIRGVVFALAFYPLRECLFVKKQGWLIMWWTLVALGILSTFGPAWGSIEGMIYTVIPIKRQMIGWLEVIPQALLLSVILHYWITHPEKWWLNWLLGSLFLLVLLPSMLGVLFSMVSRI